MAFAVQFMGCMLPPTFRTLALLVLASSSLFACSGTDDIDNEDTESSDDAVKKSARFDVITHNIAGGMNNNGSAVALDNVNSEIAASRPDAVMLQEVCQTQADAFKSQHSTWGVEFHVTRASHPQCAEGGGPLGVLIASPHGLTSVDVTDLGEADVGKTVVLLCGDTKVKGGTVRICSTHLRTKGDDAAASELARTHEAQHIVDHLKARVKGGQEVVFAGDMNTGPQTAVLDSVYRLKRNGQFGGGLFDEADQTDAHRAQYKQPSVSCAPNACRSGEATHENSKLDHIFFSANHLGAIMGDVRKAGKSDHNLYRGSAMLALGGK